MAVTKASIGLGNVDNTADRDKPISRKLQSVLDRKADENHTHEGGTGGGDMSKSTYDPNDDGVIEASHLNLSGKADSSHSHSPNSITGTAVVTNDSRLSDARTPLSHSHATTDITGTAVVTNDVRLSDARTPLTHTHSYEPANANIQTHVGSAHAPSNAQANADITKAEIEAKLTGVVSTHSHAVPSWKNGIATKNVTDASTTQNIAHGLGRVPVYVRVTAHLVYTAAISEDCSGSYNGTTHCGLNMTSTEGTSTATIDNIYSSTTQELGFTALGSTNPYTGANRQTGVITCDATNIIITWTKAGTVASATANILWECT